VAIILFFAYTVVCVPIFLVVYSAYCANRWHRKFGNKLHFPWLCFGTLDGIIYGATYMSVVGVVPLLLFNVPLETLLRRNDIGGIILTSVPLFFIYYYFIISKYNIPIGSIPFGYGAKLSNAAWLNAPENLFLIRKNPELKYLTINDNYMHRLYGTLPIHLSLKSKINAIMILVGLIAGDFYDNRTYLGDRIISDHVLPIMHYMFGAILSPFDEFRHIAILLAFVSFVAIRSRRGDAPYTVPLVAISYVALSIYSVYEHYRLFPPTFIDHFLEGVITSFLSGNIGALFGGIISQFALQHYNLDTYAVVFIPALVWAYSTARFIIIFRSHEEFNDVVFRKRIKITDEARILAECDRELTELKKIFGRRIITLIKHHHPSNI
jgi:hypothetical protein